MTDFGPIQKILIRGNFHELEDKIAESKALADELRGEVDVGSVDRGVSLMQSELDPLLPLLAR